jgi:hypothetical protein
VALPRFELKMAKASFNNTPLREEKATVTHFQGVENNFFLTAYGLK